MKKLIKLFSIATMAVAGAFALVNVSNKYSENSKPQVVEASAGKATKDYPMIINCYGEIGTGFFDGCDVGLHCWGGDLTTAKTVKIDKLTNHMGVGIFPKGAQYMKVVRAGSGSLPCDGWPSTVHNQFGEWPFDSEKNVITIKTWGGDQEYNDNKAILIKDRPVFFDTQDSDFWFGDNATAYAVTGSVSGWYDYTVSEGWNKLTRIGSTGYMYFIPSSTIIAPQVIVTRNKANASGWGNKWNQTTDMSANYGFNPLYTTMVETDMTGDKYNWGNKSAVETASEYGCYFMDKITCDGLGSITSAASNWTTVNNTYNCLTEDVQGECWKASGNSSGNNIEKAMLQYDYIVFFKQYSGYNDFINRSDSSGKSYSSSQTNPLVMSSEKSRTVAIITMISLVSVTSIGGFFFIRRRNENN